MKRYCVQLDKGLVDHGRETERQILTLFERHGYRPGDTYTRVVLARMTVIVFAWKQTRIIHVLLQGRGD